MPSVMVALRCFTDVNLLCPNCPHRRAKTLRNMYNAYKTQIMTLYYSFLFRVASTHTLKIKLS